MSIAVVRVRGKIHVSEKEEETMRRLRLTRVNHCVVVPDSMEPMVKKVANYVTWGEIDEKTLELLLLERGELEGGEKINKEVLEKKAGKKWKEIIREIMEGKITLTALGIKPFRLHPPKGGYERGGIKKHYRLGGALGYRGKKINELIRRMV